MRAFLAVFVTCTYSLLAGCATISTPSSPGAAVNLQQLERWQARGRIGVSGPEGGGSGSFDWQQIADAAQIQIRGPVGIGSVRLQLQGDTEHPEVRLETGDGAVLEAEDAWAELEARLGASLPAGNLRYWLLGLAAPGPHEWSEPTPSGEVSLEQNGWRIDYQRFTQDPGAKVPARLRASSGEARVRIVIDRWRFDR